MLWTGGVPIAACLLAMVALAACVPSEPVGRSSANLQGSGDAALGAATSGGAVQCDYWGENLPRSVSVNLGNDYAKYVYTPSDDGGSIVIDLAVAGAGALHVEGPSSNHPSEVAAWSTIDGNGLVELRVRDGALTFAALGGRALDLESPSTHYADGTPVELQHPSDYPEDVNERASALMQELAAGLGECFGVLTDFGALAVDSAPARNRRSLAACRGLASAEKRAQDAWAVRSPRSLRA